MLIDSDDKSVLAERVPCILYKIPADMNKNVILNNGIRKCEEAHRS